MSPTRNAANPVAMIALTSAVIVAGSATAWLAGRQFVRFGLEGGMNPVATCVDRTGVHSIGDSAFESCIEYQAKLFIDRDYSEAKDLSKAFLTLLVAVLIASITFSEKIVN